MSSEQRRRINLKTSALIYACATTLYTVSIQARDLPELKGPGLYSDRVSAQEADPLERKSKYAKIKKLKFA